jgi:hypothetical protein
MRKDVPPLNFDAGRAKDYDLAVHVAKHPDLTEFVERLADISGIVGLF